MYYSPLHDAPKSGTSKILTEAKLDEISDAMLRSPTTSIGKLAQETNVSVSSANRAISEELKLFPPINLPVHELKPVDHENRVQYCQWFQSSINLHS